MPFFIYLVVFFSCRLYKCKSLEQIILEDRERASGIVLSTNTEQSWFLVSFCNFFLQCHFLSCIMACFLLLFFFPGDTDWEVWGGLQTDLWSSRSRGRTSGSQIWSYSKFFALNWFFLLEAFSEFLESPESNRSGELWHFLLCEQFVMKLSNVFFTYMSRFWDGQCVF